MITDPLLIEKKSFEIITSEMDCEGLSDEVLPIVKRVIHTTADFEYGKILRFGNNPIASAFEAVRKGCRIYTDTNMILSGLSKPFLKKFGCEAYTYIDDDEVRLCAEKEGITRSIAGMRKAVSDCDTKIFLIGNAPTALFTLLEAASDNICSPSLVVGVPVGFVGACESKAECIKSSIPYIVSEGRKGGSTVAVAVFNALLYSDALSNGR